MEFARKEFGKRARKRFAEDLVQVLSGMGHDPKSKVTLVLEKKNGRVETIEEAMTAENRSLVRKSP